MYGTTATLDLSDPVLEESLTTGQRLYRLLEFLDLD